MYYHIYFLLWCRKNELFSLYNCLLIQPQYWFNRNSSKTAAVISLAAELKLHRKFSSASNISPSPASYSYSCHHHITENLISKKKRWSSLISIITYVLPLKKMHCIFNVFGEKNEKLNLDGSITWHRCRLMHTWIKLIYNWQFCHLLEYSGKSPEIIYWEFLSNW